MKKKDFFILQFPLPLEKTSRRVRIRMGSGNL